MKLLSILFAGLFASLAPLPSTVLAAEGTEAKPAAADTQTEKAPAKKAKRHSHMEEKTGMAAPAPTKTAKASKDKHLHPRDAK